MAKLDVRKATRENLSEGIRKKESSPVEVIEAFLERIQTNQPHINAFITILEGEALKAAKAAESEIVKGNYRGRLRAPVDSGHRFRSIPDTHSGGFRTPIPEDSGHPPSVDPMGPVGV